MRAADALHDLKELTDDCVEGFPLVGECEGAGGVTQDRRAILNYAEVAHLLTGSHRTISPFANGHGESAHGLSRGGTFRPQ